jgi:hypothetical protein
MELRNAKGIAEGARRKARGCIAGLPDIWIAHQGRVRCIELKAMSGRLSDSQKWLHPKLEAAGIPVAVCRSLDEVLEHLADWQIPTRIKGRI